MKQSVSTGNIPLQEVKVIQNINYHNPIVRHQKPLSKCKIPIITISQTYISFQEGMNLGSQPNLNKDDAFEVGNKFLPLGFCVFPIIIFTSGALVSLGRNVQWTCARVCVNYENYYLRL